MEEKTASEHCSDGDVESLVEKKGSGWTLSGYEADGQMVTLFPPSVMVQSDPLSLANQEILITLFL